MDVREKLEVIAHLGDHITYKEDVGICYDSALAKVIEDAYMTLKNGVTVQEWISVKDRLPEVYLRVLVCDVRENYIGIWEYIGNEMWYGEEITWSTEDITHWMPLPKPPKGE